MIYYISKLLFIFVLLTTFVNANLYNAPDLDDTLSYALMDAKTGAIVAGNNLDAKVEPASLTKIATLYLVFKSLESNYISEDDYVVISEKAWKMTGSRMFVEVGKKVQVKDLIRGVIVHSGNDASVALAEHIAGDEEFFVTMLNKLAQDIGLKNTHFENVTGMPGNNHYTSARDIAYLSAKLINDFPIQYEKFKDKKFTYNGITQYNRNKLLSTYEGADGIKTGHTNSAGYCLVSSAAIDETRFIAVVFGADSSSKRFKYSKTLLKFGFRNYVTIKYFEKGHIIARERIWNGEDKYLDIGFDRDIYVTLSKYDDKKIIPKINIISKIKAPIRNGQILGTIDFTKDNEIIASEKIYSLKRVEEGNLYRKTYDFISNFFAEN